MGNKLVSLVLLNRLALPLLWIDNFRHFESEREREREREREGQRMRERERKTKQRTTLLLTKTTKAFHTYYT
jgi:hypothetical protein